MDSILSIQRNSSMMMQPTAIISQIKTLFSTEIKWKRVLKELSDLNLLQQSPDFQVTPVGLRIPMSFQHSSLHYRFELRIDNNYPFTKPQIHSLDKNWRYSEGRDLMDYGFEEGEEWDSGMTFGDVQGLIPKIVERIRGTEEQLGKYHLFDRYFREELGVKGLELFDVVETKKKMLITHNNKKVIAFGRQVFLKFDPSDSLLTLELLLLRSEILQVQRNQPLKQLKIIYCKHNSQKQQHFRVTCDEETYTEMIYNLNPISFIEHKVEVSEEEGRSEEMMTNLTTLVSFYADKNKGKSGKYLRRLQEVISAEDVRMGEIREKEESEM